MALLALACLPAAMPKNPIVLRPAHLPHRAAAFCAAGRDEAYIAGEAAVSDAMATQVKRNRASTAEGRQFKVLLTEKPLGIVLAENPSGRGAYVLEVV